MTFRLDHDGIAELLKSAAFAGPTRDAAEAVTAAARAITDVDLDVRHYVTDRVASSVALAHPSGMALQAKYGTLTRAAAAVGLEVTSR